MARSDINRAIARDNYYRHCCRYYISQRMFYRVCQRSRECGAGHTPFKLTFNLSRIVPSQVVQRYVRAREKETRCEMGCIASHRCIRRWCVDGWIRTCACWSLYVTENDRSRTRVLATPPCVCKLLVSRLMHT